MSELNKGILFISEAVIEIHPKLSKKDFLNSKLYGEFLGKELDMNPYSWYHLKTFELFGKRMGLNLCFKDNRIYASQLFIYREENLSWDNWSEEHERGRKLEHDKILRNVLSKEPDLNNEHPYPMTEYIFDWGNISSVFDTRSGSSLIHIMYYE